MLCEGFDYTGSLNRIQTLMRAMGLRAKAGRKYKVTTDSDHGLPIAPNLLGQDFSCDTHPQATSHAKGPDQVWLSDITYLWTREGWLYVCAVLDLFTRKIVGWATPRRKSPRGTPRRKSPRATPRRKSPRGTPRRKSPLGMAEHMTRKPPPGLIFHSDRGSQYASHEVRAWLVAQAMRQSMSGTGNCYDNAPMESYWH